MDGLGILIEKRCCIALFKQNPGELFNGWKRQGNLLTWDIYDGKTNPVHLTVV